jgi:hypothetical protein
VAITIPVGVAFYWYRYGEEGLLFAIGEFLRSDSWWHVGLSLGVGLLAAIWILPLLMDTEFLAATAIYAMFAVFWFAMIVGAVLMVKVLGGAFFPSAPEPTTQAQWQAEPALTAGASAALPPSRATLHLCLPTKEPGVKPHADSRGTGVAAFRRVAGSD